MQSTIPLEYGKYYHIYNQGVSNTNLYRQNDNYEYFMHLYDKHIAPISETFAWCLLPNHFHFLIKIKDNTPARGQNDDRGSYHINKIKPPHQYFSNWFNAYTQAFNKRFSRRGTLFQRPFKRKLIENERYFQNLIIYIHNNPVHHGFVSDPIEWGWSSYISFLSNKPTKIERNFVLNEFGDVANFKHCHNINIDKLDFITDEEPC